MFPRNSQDFLFRQNAQTKQLAFGEDAQTKGNSERKQDCKPGFVVGNHLSWHPVAEVLAPPLGSTAGQASPVCGVASDRVYRTPRSPEGSVSSYLAFPPLPRRSAAVSLCCTVPEVAFGGRYPLSCPAKPGLSSYGTFRIRRTQLPILLSRSSSLHPHAKFVNPRGVKFTAGRAPPPKRKRCSPPRRFSRRGG